MRGVYYSACSLCYKTIPQFHQKCLLMRDCLLFRHLLLPESTVIPSDYIFQTKFFPLRFEGISYNSVLQTKYFLGNIDIFQEVSNFNETVCSTDLVSHDQCAIVLNLMLPS